MYEKFSFIKVISSFYTKKLLGEEKKKLRRVMKINVFILGRKN